MLVQLKLSPDDSIFADYIFVNEQGIKFKMVGHLFEVEEEIEEEGIIEPLSIITNTILGRIKIHGQNTLKLCQYKYKLIKNDSSS